MLPLRYTIRSVSVRSGSALLTVFGIALTVAVFGGIFALREGFASLYEVQGADDKIIYLRVGAGSEGESVLRRSDIETLIKERPEIARDTDGAPLAAAEAFLAVYMDKADGSGRTNVPLRGVQPMSIRMMEREGSVTLIEGRWPRWGSDEVVVGEPLTRRMAGCAMGDTITLNVVPFRVVGVFVHDGAQGGEVWGDVERMMEALDRPVFQRVIAQIVPGTDVPALAEELEQDERTPAKVQTEREYLAAQTGMLGTTLAVLASFLTLIMGASAMLGAMNTMLSSVAARTHEIGVLLAVGYGRAAIFFAFLIEAALLGALGGLLGILLTLSFNGIETGLTNWNTFTDVSLAFRVTPRLAVSSFLLAFGLGIVGGTLPALRASRMQPVEALRSL